MKGTRVLYFKIGPYRYTIYFDSAKMALRDREREFTAYGEVVYDTCEVFIMDGLHPVFERETVFHEIQHIVLWLCDLEEEEDIQKANNEHIVSVTTPVWLAFYREPENKELLEYLSGEA